VFRRYILPTVKGKCVTEITKAHALKIIDGLVARDKRRMADKVRQEGAAFFQWLLEREHVDRNAFSGIRKTIPRKTIRTRLLSDVELREIWLASEAEGRIHGVYTALRARRPNSPEISKNGVFPRVLWSGRQDSNLRPSAPKAFYLCSHKNT